MSENKVKILVVIPSLVVGGAERLTLYLLQHMDRERFELALCLFEHKGELLKEIPEDIKVVDLKKSNRWSFFRIAYDLKKAVLEYRPHLIYTRMWYATAVTQFSSLLHSSPVPIVATEEHNQRRDIVPSDRFGRIKKYLMSWAHRRADTVIVPSEGVKSDIADSYGLEPEKIQVIYNSVDLDLVKRDSESEDRQRYHFIFEDGISVIVAFGRLIPRKGFVDLLEAFSLINREVKSRLVFIGEGEERSTLEALARDLAIKDHVWFLGYVENPWWLLRKSDLFVLSSHREGFGNVIIEAMACGLPVISTNCPHGPAEIITDGVNGLLVPIGDVNTMAKAISRLLKDEPLRKRLAEAGRRRAEDFRVEKMVAEYKRIFEEVAFCK